MENSDGKNVELYLPRKCSITNVIITPKDHGSVQVRDGCCARACRCCWRCCCWVVAVVVVVLTCCWAAPRCSAAALPLHCRCTAAASNAAGAAAAALHRALRAAAPGTLADARFSQINVAHTNDDGVYNGDYESFALVGWMRSKGNSDAALEFLAKREGLI